MTTSDPALRRARRGAGRGRTRRLPVAERVELLLAGDDARGEGRPARQPLGRQRHAGPTRGGRRGRRPSTSRRCRTSSPRPGRSPLEEASAPRARPPHPGLRQRAGVRRPRARPSWCASSASCSTDSRLGIPALVHEECLTGFTTFGATVYPAAIAWAATFDPALVERMAAAIGRDMARASACTRACRPCSTSCATTAGAGSRRPSARTRTSSRMLGAAYVRGLQSAGRRRHAQALRRLLGLPGRPQPRPGLDGPARAAAT